MWGRALARGNITVHGILRAEALHHIKAVLLKLGIMGCGRRPRWGTRGNALVFSLSRLTAEVYALCRQIYSHSGATGA
jgi:hypothetical protein